MAGQKLGIPTDNHDRCMCADSDLRCRIESTLSKACTAAGCQPCSSLLMEMEIRRKESAGISSTACRTCRKGDDGWKPAWWKVGPMVEETHYGVISLRGCDVVDRSVFPQCLEPASAQDDSYCKLGQPRVEGSGRPLKNLFVCRIHTSVTRNLSKRRLPEERLASATAGRRNLELSSVSIPFVRWLNPTLCYRKPGGSLA